MSKVLCGTSINYLKIDHSHHLRFKEGRKKLIYLQGMSDEVVPPTIVAVVFLITTVYTPVSRLYFTYLILFIHSAKKRHVISRIQCTQVMYSRNGK